MSFPTMFLKLSFFHQILLNVSSFTSNSYIVLMNSVWIIRNFRAVTIQMQSVSTNSIFGNTEAVSEEALDIFTLDIFTMFDEAEVP